MSAPRLAAVGSLIAWFCSAPLVTAQSNCIDYSDYLGWRGGVNVLAAGTGVALDGSTAFVTTADSALRIVDVSDKSAPTLIASITIPGGALGVAANNDCAYVVFDGGLQVVDVSNRSHPRLRGRVALSTSPRVTGVAASGSIVCAGIYDGAYFIDATDPDHPVIRGSTGFQGIVTSVAAFGRYAYVGTVSTIEENQGEIAINEIPAAGPSRFVTSLRTSKVKALAIDPSRSELAVLDYTSRGQICRVHINARLAIYDLSNPRQPRPVTSTDYYDLWRPEGLAFSGDRLDLLMRTLYSDPGNHHWIVDRATLATLQDLFTDRSYLARSGDLTFGLANALMTLDSEITDGASAQAALNLGSSTVDVEISDGIAHIVTEQGPGSLCAVSIADPRSPQLLNTMAFNTCPYVVDVALNPPFAYAIGGNGFCVIDIASPASPAIVGNAPTTGRALAAGGDYVYVAAEQAGLSIMDISNPQQPLVVGAIDTPGTARRVAVANDIAYVADLSSGLQIVDASDPQAPSIIGSLRTPGWAMDVAIRMPYAYVADASLGLVLVDVTDPTSPALIGMTAGLIGERVAIHGSLAYLTSKQLGLLVIDVSRPNDLRLIGGNPSVYGALAADSAGVYVVPSWQSKTCEGEGWNRGGGLIIMPPGCQPVPSEVTLSYFECQAEADAIVLRWSAADENRHLGYRVQRARNVDSTYGYIGPSLIEGPGPYVFRDVDVQPGETYYYRLEAVARDGSIQQFGPLRAALVPTVTVATTLSILGPNPTSESPIELRYSLAERLSTSLNIYDVRGHLVRTLFDAQAGPGEFAAWWDGNDDRHRSAGSGVFFLQLRTGSHSVSRRLVRLR